MKRETAIILAGTLGVIGAWLHILEFVSLWVGLLIIFGIERLAAYIVAKP